mmetsp:Transcript_5858/g.13445  ORF Transcript_5858/g.13445 Transcript_5858/m.13445 type:complete len:143 (-) Transcript_5858:76-504(-)
MATVTIPAEYGYVLFVFVAHVFMNIYLGVRVGGARKAFGIKLPNAYATGKSDKDEAFNRTQRGHQNYRESAAEALGLMLVSGIALPTGTAIAGIAHLLGRVGYAVGYSMETKMRVYGELLFLPAQIYFLYGTYLTAAGLLGW